MYGVKVVTLFVCSIFLAAFSGSAKKLMDFQVLEVCLWAEAFTELQAFVNSGIRNVFLSGSVTVLRELEYVDIIVDELYPMRQNGVGPVEAEAFQNSISDLGKRSEKLSEGLDVLAKEVDGFFHIVLTGRDALLCNLRVGSNVSDPIAETNNVKDHVVR